MDEATYQGSKTSHRCMWSTSRNSSVRQITTACASQHSQASRADGH